MGNTATKESRPNAPASTATGRASRGSRERDEHGRSRKRDKVKPGYQLIIDPSEMVDGGYLYPQGVYSSPQDFKVDVVRDVIIRRKMAPFYKGLDSVDPNWIDEQLLAAIDGKTPPDLPALPSATEAGQELLEGSPTAAVENAMDDLAIDDSESTDATSGSPGLPQSSALTGPVPTNDKRSRHSSQSHPATSQPVSRRRANTTSVTQNSSGKVNERNMQALWLYRNVHECPICFLMYPRLNNTRCCGQEICTECFVQIKRAPPHPPYGESAGDAVGSPPASSDLQLISEPACCPYCAMTNLGITFEPPLFEWGIPNPDAMKSATARGTKKPDGSTLSSPSKTSAAAPPRKMSISHTHPDVITTDLIRPDWESKLASARRKLARRAAAARRLHESSLLPATNTETSRSGSGRQRRTTGSTSGLLNLQFNMSEAQTRDLENRMIEEAIRQSLREV